MNRHYLNRYNRFIAARRDRILEGYTEVHHIVPEAKGGTDDPSNLIALTAREHFIAHWILWRAYRDQQTCDAFWLMKHTRDGNIDSKSYQRLKEERSAFMSARMTGSSPNVPDHIREKNRIRMISMNKARIGENRPPMSQEQRDKTAQSVSKYHRENEPTKAQRTHALRTRGKWIEIEGNKYFGVREAARKMNIGYGMIRHRLNSVTYPKWRYL